MTGLIERKKKTLNKRGPSLERKKRQGDPAEELAAGMWKKMSAGVAVMYARLSNCLSHCN